MNKKILFFGSGNFAVPSFLRLKDNIIGLITQPDRTVKRHKLVFNPCKQVAINNYIPVYQFENVNQSVDIIKRLSPNVIIVADYGQIISQDILNIPEYGCWNIHASLLPKYRGAAPIQRAIMNGEKVTGVSIIKMDAGLDTGDIAFTYEVNIQNKNYFELEKELSEIGANLINRLINLLPNINLRQQEGISSYAKKINKSEYLINWNKSATEVNNLIRGIYGNAYFIVNNKKYKIWRAQIINDGSNNIGVIEKDIIGTSNGKIKILEIQPENGRRMMMKDFMNGYKL